MTAIKIFCILSVLLVLGKLLRIAIPFFQKLYLPSSVIGGFVGLVCMVIWGAYVPQDVITGIKMIPGFMINVIFASLFLGAATPKFKTIFKTAFPQICMGQLLAWGQYVIGLGLTGFLFIPLFGLNSTFGNLLEIGFQGGHGTVGGVSEVFTNLNLKTTIL